MLTHALNTLLGRFSLAEILVLDGGPIPPPVPAILYEVSARLGQPVTSRVNVCLACRAQPGLGCARIEAVACHFVFNVDFRLHRIKSIILCCAFVCNIRTSVSY